jgi:S-DNA-T family DNA segregation ATPase FtsK/SpoIIIE
MSRPLIRTSRTRTSRAAWLPESLRDFLLRALRVSVGGLVVALALAVTVALASYNIEDPSWNTAGTGNLIHNWLGETGSYGADLIWQSVGAGGFALAVVLAAWGWRILSDSELDMLPWRMLATLAAMLAVAIGVTALAIKVPPEMPALGGALGKLLGGGLVSLVSANWWRYLVAPLMLVIAVVALYMAAALSLSEWHVLAKALHGVIVWIARKAHYVGHSFWRILHNDKTGARDDEDEEEPEETKEIEPEEEHEAEEDEGEAEAEEKSAAKRAKKAKGPLIKRPAASARQARLALSAEGEHPLPPLDLLQWPDEGKQTSTSISEEALEKNAKLLESVLKDFGVNGAIAKVSPGPVVTLYELEPSPGTRAARVISLADDIARNMSVTSVRVATVPGRNVIGIEMPNARRETVYLRELLQGDVYHDSRATLPLVLGKDIAGGAVIADLARMPHLLIAGTTGSGKSVAINTMILSLLYRMPPQKCRFIMIDPKMLELSVYEGIPHLLAPVVTEPKKAIMALRWTVREMEERYRAMSKLGVRNIDGYNMRLREAMKNGESLMRTVQTGFDRETGKPIYEEQPLDLTELPYIVVIVDEMADLMIVAGKEIEGAIQRLAQMARAAGIHIMMATQRPSVDVITGTIKANFPTRISFQVTSKIDSRTILGEQGAEQLLGQGDMLYMAGGGRVTRVHGPFVRDDEVENIVKFLKAQGEPEYLDEVTEDDGKGEIGGGDSGGGNSNSGDDLYDKAVDIVLRERKASTSFIQRQLQLGYNKAANLVERMEREGIIGSANAMGKREVFGRKPDEE